MPKQVGYEEEWDDGEISQAKVGVANGDTRLFVTIEPTTEGTYRLAKVDQRDTTILKQGGLQLLPFAIDRLRDRFDLEAYGLFGNSVSEDELLEGDSLDDRLEEAEVSNEEIVDELEGEVAKFGEKTPTVEEYLKDVDEASVAEIADATDQPTGTVHRELAELPDPLLEKRPDPDDGRRKLYGLADPDPSPPGEITEDGVVNVAEHYDTLSEVAEDMEVTEARAYAILDEMDLLDQVDL